MQVAGVSLSKRASSRSAWHPDRVFWPDDGITKLEPARCHEAVAEHAVPHVRGRPLTLVRCPETIDECAYPRPARAWGPSALRRAAIREKTKLGECLAADDLPGLVALVQMDTLETHTGSGAIRGPTTGAAAGR